MVPAITVREIMIAERRAEPARVREVSGIATIGPLLPAVADRTGAARRARSAAAGARPVVTTPRVGRAPGARSVATTSVADRPRTGLAGVGTSAPPSAAEVPVAVAEPVVPTVARSVGTEPPDRVVPMASATTAVVTAATTAVAARSPVAGATIAGAATTGAAAAGTTGATTAAETIDRETIGRATIDRGATGPGTTGRAQAARAVTAATPTHDPGRIDRTAPSATTVAVPATGTAVVTTALAETARDTARTIADTAGGPLLGPAPTTADTAAESRTTAPPAATDIATIATDTAPTIADTEAATRTPLIGDRATAITAAAPITDREIAPRDIGHRTAGGTARARGRRAELGVTTATIAGLMRTVRPARVRRASGRPSGRRTGVRTIAASGTGNRVDRTAAAATRPAARMHAPTATGPVDTATPTSAAADSGPAQRLGGRTARVEPSTAGRPAATTVATVRGPSAPATGIREARATVRRESVGPTAAAAPPTAAAAARGSAGPATSPRCASVGLLTRSGSRSRRCRTT
jgi:hypothetical protein